MKLFTVHGNCRAEQNFKNIRAETPKGALAGQKHYVHSVENAFGV